VRDPKFQSKRSVRRMGAAMEKTTMRRAGSAVGHDERSHRSAPKRER